MSTSPKWYSQPVKNPTEGQTVWVRRNALFTPPFQATWSALTQTFTISTIGTGDPPTTLPWYQIQSWRPT